MAEFFAGAGVFGMGMLFGAALVQSTINRIMRTED